jgi:hypothetical protein
MEVLQWFLFFVLIAAVTLIFYFLVLTIVRRRKKRRPGAVVTLYFDNLQIKTEAFMFTMKTEQRIRGSFQPVDDRGDNAQLEPGTVEYESTDEDLATIGRDRDDPDNEHAFEIVSKSGFQGPVTVSLKFDGRKGEGTFPVQIDINGEVTSRDAVGGNVQLGEAVDLPEEGGEEGGGEEGEEQP